MSATFDVKGLIRENLRNLKPYSSARDEFSGDAGIFLDANENAYGSVGTYGRNRYPDPHQHALKLAVGELQHIAPSNIFIGNGSDEVIDLIIRVFCNPAHDSILTMPPTYGMYPVCAAIHDVGNREVLLTPDFQIDVPRVLDAMTPEVKVLFICLPNNPTANVFADSDVEILLRSFNGIVVIDEAYIDFAAHPGWLPRLSEFPNLVVMQTFSKAWGLANIRLGVAYAQAEIINILDKVKLPYNVNGLTQEIALQAVLSHDQKLAQVSEIVQQRAEIIQKLNGYSFVRQVFPSETNFLLVKVDKPLELYQFLVCQGVIVRDRSTQPLCEGCLRITVGTASENETLLDAFDYYAQKGYTGQRIVTSAIKPGKWGTASVRRKTNETDIEIEIELNSRKPSSITTGLGFFDHMLEQIARHAGVSLTISVKGDLHVDEHHTIEDTGIALGEAFNRALGDKRGIGRYGFVLPMDESLARVAIDFSGRPWLQWDVAFVREKVGDVPTEMLVHFFRSFADAARCTLHMSVAGENEHHKIEALFKGLAKALQMAIRRDFQQVELPSTKGIL